MAALSVARPAKENITSSSQNPDIYNSGNTISYGINKHKSYLNKLKSNLKQLTSYKKHKPGTRFGPNLDWFIKVLQRVRD